MRNFRIIIFALFLFLLVAVTSALHASTVKECDVEGRGEDQRAAILNGLVQAVEQVNGTSIDRKSVTYRQYRDAVDDLKNSFQSSVTGNSEIKDTTHGLVDSYDVLDQSIDPQTHTTQVHLHVRVLAYDPLGPLRAGQRKVIAVLPFRSAHPNYQIMAQSLPSDEMIHRLGQELVNRVVQSRKFTVLDRDFLAELLGEQKLIEAGNMPTAEQIRIGEQLGADFLLVGEIEEISASQETHRAPNSYRQVTDHTAYAQVSYRIVNVATGKIHWADTCRWTAAESDFTNLPDSTPPQIESLVLGGVADEIAEGVVDHVFPLTVIKPSGDEFILNQGGMRIKVGALYDVFSQGPIVVDPDTKEPLDPEETLVGRLQITRVTPKMSYARLISGSAANIISAQAICKPAK